MNIWTPELLQRFDAWMDHYLSCPRCKAGDECELYRKLWVPVGIAYSGWRAHRDVIATKLLARTAM